MITFKHYCYDYRIIAVKYFLHQAFFLAINFWLSQVYHLSNLGGRSVFEAVKRMMTEIVPSPEFQQTFNFTGGGKLNKTALKGTKTFAVLCSKLSYGLINLFMLAFRNVYLYLNVISNILS